MKKVEIKVTLLSLILLLTSCSAIADGIGSLVSIIIKFLIAVFLIGLAIYILYYIVVFIISLFL